MTLRATVFLCFCLGTLAGCASTPRIAVPTELANRVVVADAIGQGPVRVWGDSDSPLLKREAANRLRQIKARRPALLKDRRRVVSYLALSGGGSNGAFGSGFLNGWSANGTRPEFEVVSGVSTGALMAPFAFLGRAYDKPLREIYTEYSTRDLIRPQVLAGLAGGSSLADTTPLRKMIAKYVDRKLFKAIADEHAKGRRLLVGTTNIDADRPVIWNMGQIAQRGTPEALELFRSVLLASAALPGLFPPVFVKVSADGKTYEEMHVDGGTTDNAFLIPQNANVKAFGDPGWKRKLYIIANDKTGPAPDVTKVKTMDILGRSMATLIKQQLEGDLIKLYLRSKKNAIDYNEISIPSSFREKSKEAFDKEYMRKLYKFGYEMGRAGIKWRKKPSGI
ncbi:MAG: patatin-like phospholipase family protein [Pseudomonadota bacterium]